MTVRELGPGHWPGHGAGNYGDWDHGVTHHRPMANRGPILVTVTWDSGELAHYRRQRSDTEGSNLQISQISSFHDVVKLSVFP